MGRRPRDDGEGGCDIEQLHLTVLGVVSLLLAGTGCNPPPTPKSLWQSSAVMLSHWLYVWDGRLRKWSRLGLGKGFSTKRVMFYTHFIHLEREKGQGKQRDPGLSFSFEMNCAHLHTPPRLKFTDWNGWREHLQDEEPSTRQLWGWREMGWK